VTDSIESVFLRSDEVVTAAELLSRGASRDQLHRWARDGWITSVAHGVYAPTEWLEGLTDDPRRLHGVAVSALVRRNPGLVASHESAAYLHGIELLLPAGREVPVVTLTRRPKEPSRALIRGALVRAATLPDDHVTTAFGVPVTTVARTVMDIARASGFMEGVVAADSALHSHVVVKVEFAIILEGCGQWPGVVRARQVLGFADGRAESALESVARVRFAEFGIRPPALQVNIRGRQGFIGRVDFCWHEYRTIAEADGAMKYDDQGRERARAQLARDEKFHDEGWGTFHFTWREIYHEPEPTIERLRRTFARNAPHSGPGTHQTTLRPIPAPSSVGSQGSRATGHGELPGVDVVFVLGFYQALGNQGGHRIGGPVEGEGEFLALHR
jgi:very-short-patch-repair endonuclease